jgi:hypothetical protein
MLVRTMSKFIFCIICLDFVLVEVWGLFGKGKGK